MVEIVTRRRRRRPVRNALLGLLACMTLLAALVGSGVLYLEHRLTRDIDRIDGVFDGLEHRPAVPAQGADAVNILLMGTDRRSDVGTSPLSAAAPRWTPGAHRTDTLMLVHIDGSRRAATVVSIPLGAWVQVPGHGMATINAAFSYGGPSLAVATVEALTDVRIDHLAVIDWEGFRELTDAVGGVTVTVPRTVHDPARGITWTAGQHTLDGQQALAYIEQRHGLPQGDLDRVQRQQTFLRELMEDSLRTQMRTSPSMVVDFTDTVTRHLSVDAEWSAHEMAILALSLRNLRTTDIRYVTAPVAGLGLEGRQSVVHLSQVRCAALWQAVRTDRLDVWAGNHPEASAPVAAP